MIKISKELKAGFATLLILSLFYWGFTYLKGRNLFDGGTYTYFSVFKTVNGLKKSSPVMMSGMNVGSVTDVYFIKDSEHFGEVMVEFDVDNKITFSKESKVKIQSNLMGGSYMVIVPTKKGDIAVSGTTFVGGVEPGALSSLTNKLDPLQSKIESVLEHLDSVLVKTNHMLDQETVGDVKESFASLNKILTNLEYTTQKVNAEIDETLSNVNQSTENLKVFSDSLSKVEIVAISNKLNNTLTDLNNITSDIQKGKGTIGMLAKDEKLYNNLEAASKELEQLLRDVKEHPKRFVHFSLFGKKEKPYQEPKEN
ncbi:MlaD family protein [Ochrovirga pacifica]|uniref:MlaD family protein n=1 Tax=Ochrovirga pacifica TaxID=1042376 RepID=UPI000255A297|nr:MlaD family protein [Ochrovirga pacifica]